MNQNTFNPNPNPNPNPNIQSCPLQGSMPHGNMPLPPPRPYPCEDDEEIDIKMLIYKALVHWRKAVILGIVFALLGAAYSLIGVAGVLTDEDSYNYELAIYEGTYSGWESTEDILNAKIENLQEKKAQQEEYNEKSEIMQIDPLDKWVGRVSYFVNTNYKINPELSYQDTDYTKSILAAYSNYFTSGEFYQAIVDQTSFEEQKYVKEILSAGVDYNAGTITINVIGREKAAVEKIFSLTGNLLSEKSLSLSKSVANHSLSTVGTAIYSEVDYELQHTQEANKNAVKEYDVSVSELYTEILEWRESDEPKFDYSLGSIIKGALKWFIIGGVVGVFLVCGWYAVAYLLSGSFAEEKMTSFGPCYVLGKVFTDSNEKKPAFSFVDEWLKEVFGIDQDKTDFSTSCKIVRANIESVLANIGRDSLAVIGAADEKLAATIIGEAKGVKYCGNILSSDEAVLRLADFETVCIIACENLNTSAEIMRQLENLRAWGKLNIGIIIVK